MRKLALILAACSLVVGCGFSSAEISVGDSLAIQVQHAPGGTTAVNVTMGAKDCRTASVSLFWDDLAARVAAC